MVEEKAFRKVLSSLATAARPCWRRRWAGGPQPEKDGKEDDADHKLDRELLLMAFGQGRLVGADLFETGANADSLAPDT